MVYSISISSPARKRFADLRNFSHEVKRSTDVIALLSLTSIRKAWPKSAARLPGFVQQADCLFFKQRPFFPLAKVSIGRVPIMV
jgi:hypothetical protein